MRAFLNDLKEHWEGWAALGLVIVTLMMLSGCNNPNYRPHRDDPYSIRSEHWMDRWCWMDVKEAEDKSYYKATHKSKSWGDYFFR